MTIQINHGMHSEAPKAMPKEVKSPIKPIYDAISQLRDGDWFVVPNTEKGYGSKLDRRVVGGLMASIRRHCTKLGIEGIAVYLAADGKTGVIVKRVSDGVEDATSPASSPASTPPRARATKI